MARAHAQARSTRAGLPSTPTGTRDATPEPESSSTGEGSTDVESPSMGTGSTDVESLVLGSWAAGASESLSRCRPCFTFFRFQLGLARVATTLL
jgi:hypothetical protein